MSSTRSHAENSFQDFKAAFESLLVEFKTVVDDDTAREKLPQLLVLNDELVTKLHELEEAQKKSYATGGGLVIRDSEAKEFKNSFGEQFGAHRNSLPKSTITILNPFFEKLSNGPIK